MRISARTWAFIIFGLSAAVFIATMEPSVGLIDSGELALACSELGIAHPTGYPLYSLLGRIFNIILPVEPVVASNFFSAIMGGVSAVLVFFIAHLILLSIAKSAGSIELRLLASTTAILFAFSRTFWAEATITEVHALDTALNLAGLYFIVLWAKRDEGRMFLAGAFIFGLSFGAHMLTLMFAPAVLIIAIFARKHLSLKLLAASIALFALGLTVYVYLPVRANCSPIANFGDPSTWERFFRHISAWQYRVWMFDRPFVELFSVLKDFGVQLMRDATVVSIPLVALGGIFMFRRWKAIFWALLAIFIFDVLYSLNYSIPDIHAYFLPAIFVWLIFATIGVLWLNEKFSRYGTAIVAVFACVALAVIPVRWREHDRSDYYFIEEVAHNILAHAPRDAIIYLNNWDVYAPVRYLHIARGYRPDVVLLDFELMRRSWYLEQKLAEYPAALSSARPLVLDFIAKVLPFEREEDYSPAELETAWREMHFGIVRRSLARRPVCGTFFGGEMGVFFDTAPKAGCGALIEILPPDREPRYIPPAMFALDELEKRLDRLTPREKIVASVYSEAWLTSANAFYEASDYDRAVEFLELNLRFHPDDWGTYKNIATIRIEQGRYEDAKLIFIRAEHLLPIGSYPEMIYDDLDRRIHVRDSLRAIQ
ncbi:MAG TPA: DUF2723 domain-containing protein [candidate division Zixibacteria bacterium]|nr:DUF2723 domain-containing protein [candidate division Zixibacteria bacterium]